MPALAGDLRDPPRIVGAQAEQLAQLEVVLGAEGAEVGLGPASPVGDSSPVPFP